MALFFIVLLSFTYVFPDVCVPRVRCRCRFLTSYDLLCLATFFTEAENACETDEMSTQQVAKFRYSPDNYVTDERAELNVIYSIRRRE